jgi:Mce-associated membrane protein
MAVDADAAGELTKFSQTESLDAGPQALSAASDRDDDALDPNADNADGVDRGDNASFSPAAQRRFRAALIAGLAVIVTLGSLGGWLGYQRYQSQQAEWQRELFLRVGRQTALNMTTIDYTHAEADIQRILDSSTGTLYDDFRQRSAAFAEVVKKAQSKTEGIVTEAGRESLSEDSARVLVAVSVTTSHGANTDQKPRLWRMRIDVQKDGDGAKASKVGFVP